MPYIMFVEGGKPAYKTGSSKAPTRFPAPLARPCVAGSWAGAGKLEAALAHRVAEPRFQRWLKNR